jgi:pyrimidine-specific ribonucleoside hydrolase
MTAAATDVVLVVDTGVDDALALLLALRSPILRVRAVACVAGNVEVDQVVANTLRVLDAAGAAEVPVGQGTTPGPGGRSVHGVDGMADLALPAPVRDAPLRSIADVLDLAVPYVLLSLAPCTDVAPALSRQISSMIAIAGFNREHDPAAFDAVVGCGVPAVVYQQPVWQRARVSTSDAERLASAADPATALAGLLLRHQVRRGGSTSGSIGDAVAVAALLAGTVNDPDPRECASTFLDALHDDGHLVAGQPRQHDRGPGRPLEP